MEMKFEIINCIILLWLYNMLTSWGRGRTSQKKNRNASSESLSNSYYNCNVQYICMYNERDSDVECIRVYI